MPDKIVQIFPNTNFKGLEEIAREQDVYYGRVQEITGLKLTDMSPMLATYNTKLAEKLNELCVFSGVVCDANRT